MHLCDICSPASKRDVNPALVVLYFSHAEKHAKKWIDDIEEIAKKEKAHITSEIIIDVPSVPNAIIEYAEKQHADLIIMETRRRAGTKQLLLGSVASAVVAHVKSVVLLVQQKIIIQNNHNSKKQGLVAR